MGEGWAKAGRYRGRQLICHCVRRVHRSVDDGSSVAVDVGSQGGVSPRACKGCSPWRGTGACTVFARAPDRWSVSVTSHHVEQMFWPDETGIEQPIIVKTRSVIAPATSRLCRIYFSLVMWNYRAQLPPFFLNPSKPEFSFCAIRD